MRSLTGKRILGSLPAVLGMLWLLSASAEPGRYLGIDEFLQEAFTSVPTGPETLIVDAALRERVEAILGHRFARLRVRYWDDGNRTAWILDEIGKTEPITIGVAVESGQIATVRILEFRESRGWEVRYPFFTGQFKGAGLDEDSTIDRPIDSITGATLSVTAVTKVARIALIFDEHVGQPENQDTT